MNTVEPDLREMRRLLHGHQWSDLAEWGDAIRALADLSDEQIDLLVTPNGAADDAVFDAVVAPGADPDADSADCAGERAAIGA